VILFGLAYHTSVTRLAAAGNMEKRCSCCSMVWSLTNKLINLNVLPYNQLQLPSNISSNVLHGEICMSLQIVIESFSGIVFTIICVLAG